RLPTASAVKPQPGESLSDSATSPRTDERCMLKRMTAGDAKRVSPALILLALMAASLAALLLLPPILQDQNYHRFADHRTLFGVPNFWNVVSNLPFIAVGAVGLWRFHRNAATFVIFLGIFLTGFGSSYYHWQPSDSSLLWDRLPMTLCFTAILAFIVE